MQSMLQLQVPKANRSKSLSKDKMEPNSSSSHYTRVEIPRIFAFTGDTSESRIAILKTLPFTGVIKNLNPAVLFLLQGKKITSQQLKDSNVILFKDQDQIVVQESNDDNILSKS